MISGSDIQPLIEERLGRPMLDELEAAVVLEAFAGLDADTSLELGREAAVFRSRVRPEQALVPKPSIVEWRSVVSDIAFIIGVLVLGFWLSRRTGAFGVDVVDRSWRLALPVSLGAQWFLRRRVLVGPDGLGRLRREAWLLWSAVVLVGGLSLVPRGGLIAAVLASVWIGGFLASRRGWGVAHCGAVVATLCLSPLLANWLVLVALVVMTFLMSGVALVSSRPSDRMVGSFGRSLPSGLIGVCLAFFLVVEPEISWGASTLLASTTIIPALLGAVVGGLWMTRIWTVVPRSLSKTPASSSRIPAAPLGVFVQAIGATLATVVVSSAIVMFAVQRHESADLRGTAQKLLVAHAALALAGLCVSVLEAFGRWAIALVAAATGAVASGLLGTISSGPVTPGARILVGAIVALALSMPWLLATLCRPAHRIAASL